MTEHIKKIGILWGGGLGDLLMIRPLLAAAHADTKIATFFCTTASHATELYQEFCSPTMVVPFPRNTRDLLPAIKRWRHFFDLLYLGPYPSLKTQMLARLLQPKKIWCKRHRQEHPFMLEQVLYDCAALGLGRQTAAADFISFLPWPVDSAVAPLPEKQPFIVMHAGAKQRWETTRWPAENWAVLTKRILDETSFNLCFVGVASEEPIIAEITAGLPAAEQGRIRRCISLPVRDTARFISASSGVICHNSGILHLATFLGKKTVCITGSSARYWQPPYPWVKNITSTVCSRACNRYTCAIPFYRSKCIKSITAPDAWQAIKGHGLLLEAK
jgi:ADP-heptose:LPS heptosyltransferase